MTFFSLLRSQDVSLSSRLDRRLKCCSCSAFFGQERSVETPATSLTWLSANTKKKITKSRTSEANSCVAVQRHAKKITFQSVNAKKKNSISSCYLCYLALPVYRNTAIVKLVAAVSIILTPFELPDLESKWKMNQLANEPTETPLSRERMRSAVALSALVACVFSFMLIHLECKHV